MFSAAVIKSQNILLRSKQSGIKRSRMEMHQETTGNKHCKTKDMAKDNETCHLQVMTN